MQTSSVINQLTAGEMAIAERTAGLSIATLEDPNFPKVNILGALGWVHAKRSDQNLKFEDYMNAHTLEQITEQLGISAEDEAGKE